VGKRDPDAAFGVGPAELTGPGDPEELLTAKRAGRTMYTRIGRDQMPVETFSLNLLLIKFHHTTAPG
jgi:hypothetical protein